MNGICESRYGKKIIAEIYTLSLLKYRKKMFVLQY
jgi:hypothetical protein